MLRRRVVFFASGLALLVLSTRGNGQDASARSLVVAEHIGLPAVEGGMLPEESHAPDAPEAIKRAALRARLRPDRASAAGTHYVPGRLLVKFHEGASDAERADAVWLSTRTGEIAVRPSYVDFDVVRLDPGEDVEVAASALAGRQNVEYAQPAYRVHTMFVPNDPEYKQLQWNFPMIDLERAWDIQPLAGSRITVAVLDTGLAYQNATVTANLHAFVDEQGTIYPSLGVLNLPYSAAPQMVGAGHAGRIIAPRDFIWDSNTPLDFDGHGTHVSGTIGQLTNDLIGTAGVAFNVNIMPVKVIDAIWDDIFASPNVATDEVVARGIRYAADSGAKVLNLSIGRTGEPAPAIESAIRYAVGKGAFVAIAGGNGFEEGNDQEVLAEIASRVPGAVSVAAVDRAKAHAYYSTTGKYIELSAPGGSERGFGRDGFVWQQTFDFTFTDTFLLPPSQYMAPRFDILRTVGYIGTSMATPHVAGIAAMLMQQGITDPAAIEAALEKFAVDLGDPGRDDTFGFGLVNARDTLRGLGPAR